MRALALVLILAACAPRAALVQAPLPYTGPVQSVFTATLREGDNNVFGGNRTNDPRFHRYDITLPPDRAPGTAPGPSRRPDPSQEMLLADAQEFATPRAFYQAIAQTNPGHDALLYVHGYNNTHADGILRVAQMATDFGFEGPAAHFSWASAGAPFGYAYDSDSVAQARDGLETTLRGMLGQRRVLLVAHSMGSYLAMEALRQIAIAGDAALFERLAGVILISPDIDVDVFRAQAERLGPLPQPFVVFTSTRDRALRISAGITGLEARLGNLQDLEPLADLNIAFVDVSQLSGGDLLGHFTAATSPEAIRLIQGLRSLEEISPDDGAGLGQATALTLRRATRLVLPSFSR